jgi:hypothetical protein
MVKPFQDKDAEYLAWCEANPEAFVVNTTRTYSPAYMKLHRASCWTVTRLFGRGKRLTGEYVKLCAATRADLEAWAAQQGGELDPCGLCLS